MKEKAKTFYVVTKTDLVTYEKVTGTLADARKVLDSDAYEDGTYLILEDTSGDVVKSTETVKKSKVTFTVPEGRKRQRGEGK